MRNIAIPSDDKLPGLRALLNPELMKRRLYSLKDGDDTVADCRVAYVRYRPGENCVASYVVTRTSQAGGNTRELLGYGICFHPKAFARACRKVLAQAWAKTPKALPITALHDHQILLFAYPNDRKLKGLRTVEPKDELKQLLSECSRDGWFLTDRRLTTNRVVYKPEKRAVFRCQLTTVNEDAGKPSDTIAYLKVYPDEQAARVHATLTQLLQSQGSQTDFSIPCPLAFARNHHVLVISSLPGTKLTSLIGDACAREAFERTAQALARLHAHHDPNVPRRTVANYLAGAQASLALLVQSRPELKERIQEIIGLLHAMMPEDEACSTGFLHGDLGLNVLIDSKRIGFIDFDRAHFGPIGADIGNLLSRLHNRRLEVDSNRRRALKEAFLTAYFKAARRSWAPGVVSWWTALPLIQDALRSVRRLDVNGPDSVKELTEDVLRLLHI